MSRNFKLPYSHPHILSPLSPLSGTMGKLQITPNSPCRQNPHAYLFQGWLRAVCLILWRENKIRVRCSMWQARADVVGNGCKYYWVCFFFFIKNNMQILWYTITTYEIQWLLMFCKGIVVIWSSKHFRSYCCWYLGRMGTLWSKIRISTFASPKDFRVGLYTQNWNNSRL